jgi:hypothetical protein
LQEVDQDHILTTIDPRRQQTLAKQNEVIKEENAVLQNGNAGELTEPRKPFVEPVISVPVDVLEATTFFQAATSGATN